MRGEKGRGEERREEEGREKEGGGGWAVTHLQREERRGERGGRDSDSYFLKSQISRVRVFSNFLKLCSCSLARYT